MSDVAPSLPPLHDLLATARVVALPLVTRFRGIDVREAVLFEGPEGWTEFAPFAEYPDDEAATWLAAAIDFGWHAAPPPVRDRVLVNATVPSVDPDAVPSVLERFPGCRTAKVKVAASDQTLAQDVARVRAVREALGPEGRVRIDANAGWNIDEAEHAIHALAPFDLEYVEQPCATVDELAEIRTRTKYMGIPIAADESVRRADDPLAVAEVHYTLERAGAGSRVSVVSTVSYRSWLRLLVPFERAKAQNEALRDLARLKAVAEAGPASRQRAVSSTSRSAF